MENIQNQYSGMSRCPATPHAMPGFDLPDRVQKKRLFLHQDMTTASRPDAPLRSWPKAMPMAYASAPMASASAAASSRMSKKHPNDGHPNELTV